MYQCRDGVHKRKVFCRTHLEPFEKEAVDNLKEYLRKKAPNIHYPDELLLRFNYAGRFQMSEVNEQVRLYDKWHQNQIITVLGRQGKEILEQGHVYSYGRDYQYCPVIILRPYRVDLKKYTYDHYLNALHALLQPLEEYMLYPGVIEKWNLLIDFENRAFKNSTQAKTEVKCISYAYPYRLKRVFLLNAKKSQESVTTIRELLTETNSDCEVVEVKQEGLMQYMGED